MIFPSLWEGLPGAVLEASAAGLPVLASDLSGIKEIARFFPQVDCVSLGQPDETWSDRALQLLASHGRLSRHYGDRELRFSQSPFSIDRAVMDLEDIYSSG